MGGDLLKLAEDNRILWIKTVLTITATEQQRRAFIAGYNESSLYDVSSRPSPQMWERYALGQKVSAILNPTAAREPQE